MPKFLIQGELLTLASRTVLATASCVSVRAVCMASKAVLVPVELYAACYPRC
jgi:hypothetical protein